MVVRFSDNLWPLNTAKKTSTFGSSVKSLSDWNEAGRMQGRLRRPAKSLTSICQPLLIKRFFLFSFLPSICSFLSFLKVNLDSRTKCATKAFLEAAGLFADECFAMAAVGECLDMGVFNLAQAKIEQLMEKDSYQRFLKSDTFLEIVQHASKDGGKRRATVESTFASAYANQQVQHRRRRTDRMMPMTASFGKRILLVLFLKFLPYSNYLFLRSWTISTLELQTVILEREEWCRILQMNCVHFYVKLFVCL